MYVCICAQILIVLDICTNTNMLLVHICMYVYVRMCFLNIYKVCVHIYVIEYVFIFEKTSVVYVCIFVTARS